jgi:predicted Zn-dependent protease
VASSAPAERPRRDVDDVRRRIAMGMEGTYIHEMLAARDSAIARWPDRLSRPLRVHVRESEELESWNPDFTPAVRDAFDTWVQSGIPVRFTFVRDSATADIHVRFVSSFANGISGKTVWSRDGLHWLLSSDIQLAVTHPNGGSITPPQMRAIALHEVGHLLGLDHTSDPDNIMSARIRVRELSEADRATVRLVYSVPAGSLK